MNTRLDHFEVFPWHEHFNTGINRIDEQHQKLVALLNRLACSLTLSENPDSTEPFDELTRYACVHFSDEEQIWSEYFEQDDWLTSHHQSHATFVSELGELKQRAQGQQPQDVFEEIIHFLIRWLAFHILFEDKRMALALLKEQQGIPKLQAKEHASQTMNNSMRDMMDSVLAMYDGLSSRTLRLMREQKERIAAQEQLQQLNQQLEHLTITDALTGLHNRRHFDAVFESELKRAVRNQTPLTLMLIDLDHFKHLNDHYGHSAGDLALQRVGQALSEVCRRPSDFCFRIGGEELAVVCADQSPQGALEFAERIRAHIESLAIANAVSKQAPVLTASLGVCTLTPTPTTPIKAFFNEADNALYKAKESGRNRVSSAS